MFKVYLVVLLSLGFKASAQILVEDQGPGEGAPLGTVQAERPAVGRGAAVDYFKKRDERKASPPVDRNPSSLSSSDRVLMLHAGTFLNDKAYRWGREAKVEGRPEQPPVVSIVRLSPLAHRFVTQE